jgi:hypothetical protein
MDLEPREKGESMSENKKSKPVTPPPSESLSTGEIPKQSRKAIHVRYRRSPSSRPDKKIHPRQKMPPVPEGEEMPDHTPSPPVELD